MERLVFVFKRLVYMVHPRLRVFFSQVFLMTVAWLATAGAFRVFSGEESPPNPVVVGALLFGSALGALFRDLPDRQSQPLQDAVAKD